MPKKNRKKWSIRKHKSLEEADKTCSKFSLFSVFGFCIFVLLA